MAQTIKLYVADLVFGDDGTPTVNDGKQADIGAWGAFDTDDITIPPKQFVEVGFTIRVPAGADPGDHVGAVVAESQPQGGAIKIVKRVATRLYVTVPGDATKSFTISEVTKRIDSGFFARKLDVEAILRNTGRVRLQTAVHVSGVAAKGPKVLLAQSVEKYTATVKVPWWGGPVKATVRAVTDGGTKQVTVSAFVIPWHLLLLIPVAVGAWLAGRVALRWRRRKIRGLREDLRRLEKLVTERPTPEPAPVPVPAQSPVHAPAEPEEVVGKHFAPSVPFAVAVAKDAAEAERIRGLREAIKRAQRSGSQEALERLALALYATGEDASNEISAALEHAEGDARDALIDAASTYIQPEPPEPEQPAEPNSSQNGHPTAEELADHPALSGFAAALADYVSHGND